MHRIFFSTILFILLANFRSCVRLTKEDCDSLVSSYADVLSRSVECVFTSINPFSLCLNCYYLKTGFEQAFNDLIYSKSCHLSDDYLYFVYGSRDNFIGMLEQAACHYCFDSSHSSQSILGPVLVDDVIDFIQTSMDVFSCIHNELNSSSSGRHAVQKPSHGKNSPPFQCNLCVDLFNEACDQFRDCAKHSDVIETCTDVTYQMNNTMKAWRKLNCPVHDKNKVFTRTIILCVIGLQLLFIVTFYIVAHNYV